MNNTGIEYLSTESTPTVLSELAELLPPLTEEQFSSLEADILQNGCYSPVITNEELIVVDGHNRMGICEKHGIPYRIAVFHFEDMLEAKQWALDTQKGRRNLDKWELGKIALKLKPDIETKAKERQGERTDLFVNSQKSSESVNTTKELAEAVGIGDQTMSRVIQIDEKAPEAIKKALDNKEISVNKGYELTRKLQEVPEDQREAMAAAILDADKAFQEKDAEVERKGRVAKQICTAFEKSFLMQPTEENIRIWIDYAGIRSDMVDDMIGQAEDLSKRYAAFAEILRKMKPEDWRAQDETGTGDTGEGSE